MTPTVGKMIHDISVAKLPQKNEDGSTGKVDGQIKMTMEQLREERLKLRNKLQ